MSYMDSDTVLSTMNFLFISRNSLVASDTSERTLPMATTTRLYPLTSSISS